jgi:hypothetical protein
LYHNFWFEDGAVRLCRSLTAICAQGQNRACNTVEQEKAFCLSLNNGQEGMPKEVIVADEFYQDSHTGVLMMSTTINAPEVFGLSLLKRANSAAQEPAGLFNEIDYTGYSMKIHFESGYVDDSEILTGKVVLQGPTGRGLEGAISLWREQ